MSPAPGPYSQFGNNPQQVLPPPMPTGGPIDAKGATANWRGRVPGENNFYGGQQIAGATPDQADYQSVQGYADAAHQNARRYLDPQQNMQNRRFDQELINRGIDPNSAQGQEQAKLLGMQQADANNAAAFGALQFGQGIQNQMFNQEHQQAQLAGQMRQGLWGAQNQAQGQQMQFDLGKMNAQNQFGLGRMNALNNYNLGLAGLGSQNYQAELGHQLGMGQLDIGRNQTEHAQMMDLLGYDMQTRQYNDQQRLIQDALFNQWYGNTPVPGMTPVDVQGGANQWLGAGEQTTRTKEGGGGVTFSDRRLKRNISKVGEINGVNMYRYNYLWDDVERIGPMAQEVPWAAVTHPSGFLMINGNKVF
jgi:hypothetical protein